MLRLRSNRSDLLVGTVMYDGHAWPEDVAEWRLLDDAVRARVRLNRYDGGSMSTKPQVPKESHG